MVDYYFPPVTWAITISIMIAFMVLLFEVASRILEWLFLRLHPKPAGNDARSGFSKSLRKVEIVALPPIALILYFYILQLSFGMWRHPSQWWEGLVTVVYQWINPMWFPFFLILWFGGASILSIYNRYKVNKKSYRNTPSS